MRLSITGLKMGTTWFIFLPFVLGVAMSALLHTIPLFTSLPSIHEDLLRTFLLGQLIVTWTSVMILSGSVDRIMIRLGYRPVYESVLLGVMGVMEGLQNAVHHESNYLRDNWNSDKLLEMLEVFEDSVIAPVSKHTDVVVLTIVLALVADSTVSIGWYSLPSITANVTTQLPFLQPKLFTWTNLLVYVCTVVGLWRSVGNSCKFWCDKFYQSVKDENYLVGMELQNSQEVGS
jgi:hypothetical protein